MIPPPPPAAVQVQTQHVCAAYPECRAPVSRPGFCSGCRAILQQTADVPGWVERLPADVRREHERRVAELEERERRREGWLF